MQKYNTIFIKIINQTGRSKCIGILFLTLLMIQLSFGLSVAQPGKSGTIKTSANVVPVSEIETITLKDLEIDLSMAVKGVIQINPLRDSQVGLIMLKGKPNAPIKVTFLPKIELSNKNGKGLLSFEYQVFGFHDNNQLASEPIDAIDRNIRFSNQGIYYLWIGGKIETNNARPGNYEGEFTLEIEYI